MSPIVLPSCSSRGRHRRRAEDGAAVRREAGDAAVSSHRMGSGKPDLVDAAPAGGARNLVPGRPWPTVRRHYDRLPAVLRSDGLYAAATNERGPPLGIRGLRTGPVAARKRGPKGLQERRSNSPDLRKLVRVWSAGRRLSPIARRRRRLHYGVSGGLAGRSGSDRKLPRFPALRSPRGSEDLECEEGLPGADIKNTGDESRLFFGAKRAALPRACVARSEGPVRLQDKHCQSQILRGSRADARERLRMTGESTVRELFSVTGASLTLCRTPARWRRA
jgi:hypothetical protein